MAFCFKRDKLQAQLSISLDTKDINGALLPVWQGGKYMTTKIL